jgi:hypothetical protein
MDFNCRSDRHCLARVFQRQAFLRRTSGCEGAIRTIHHRDFADPLKCRNSAVPKGEKALLEVIKSDMVRGGVRCFQSARPEATS